MQSTLIRLAVGLLAFGLGVSVTMLWIAYRTPGARKFKTTSCWARAASLPPAPSVGELPPPPPAPPAPFMHFGRLGGSSLDDMAIRKPAPVYPASARAARASGTVLVHVSVDEDGKVMSADAISGDRALWAAAEEAATQAEFKRARVEDEPYVMTGTLTYNFVPR
jgi:TonB family protein